MESDGGRDRRIGKTRKAIKRALAKLMIDKNLEKINVSELCNIADISRRTFYLHYSSVEAVFKEIEDDIFSGYYNLQCRYNQNGKYDMQGIYSALVRGITNDLAYYRDLAKGKGSAELFIRLYSSFRSIRLDFITNNEQSTMYHVQTFLNAGLIATIFEWLCSDSPITIQELGDCIQRICLAGHKEFDF
ncbi:TetR/AcrR family transcriptional regulator [Desulfosporosinus lacus]|uniref:Transcriptional regulator, TetR family n=1 Tax=Desulfosporosinus lacus DSM 15449 TaxID=1121420 RepID=A0A1M5ZSB7_9FIRM|nr:TetR/AcrR family transcriptional regulator [Desulfosporosinus lacus]SHI27197.1 transcriptional regulator, TetR family [Desulfosporosinus lacus DSM 15449]